MDVPSLASQIALTDAMTFASAKARADALGAVISDVWLAQLAIGGIEVTQAIQYFGAEAHLIDPADRGPDNSIRLVAGKPAWVRVYPWSVFGISGITAELEVQRRQFGLLWKTVTTLQPVAPVMTTITPVSQTDYATTRGSLNHTLNFIIPGDEMIGTLRLVARVDAGSFHAERTTTVPVTLRQTLRLAGVMIAYNGPASMAPGAPNLQLAAPTLADLQTMSARALTLYPVQSQAQFRTAGTLTLTHHLQDTSFPTSGCGAGWNALVADVANARTADGNQPGWIYYGLFDTGVPRGPVGGCGGGGVAVGPINAPGTLAHEGGHAAGLGHAPAGGAPNPDPNYPAYEPYDPPGTAQASIGEYGLDVNDGTIASPQLFRDFMAYGGPAWISLYHYGKLLNNGILNPETVGIDSPWWIDKVYEEFKKWPWLPEPDPPPFDIDRPPLELGLPMFPPDYPVEDVISLIVRVERGVVAEVTHVARTSARTHLERAQRTPLVASLRDEEGNILAEAPLFELESQPEFCAGCEAGDDPGSYIAQAFVPDVAPGVLLEIGDGQESLWRREAPKRPARVEHFEASAEPRGRSAGRLRVGWAIAGNVEDLWVRWSADGETWRSLATGLTGDSAEFDLQMLPPGEIRLQLVAHDGFFSTYSEPVSVEVPERGPEVVIFHPVDAHTYTAGQAVRLWGMATSGGEDDVPERRATWLLGRKQIAQGLDTWTTLPPGEHTLALRVDDEHGSGRASVKINVVEIPESN